MPLPVLFAASFVSVPAIFISCEALVSDCANDVTENPKSNAAVKMAGTKYLTVLGIFIA